LARWPSRSKARAFRVEGCLQYLENAKNLANVGRGMEAELTDEAQVQKHYTSEGITARMLAAFRAVRGSDVPITPETLAPIDHFHGKGATATEELTAVLQPKASDHLLDIGCGIGGPARWIAAKCRCRVTGVDLTPEFCEAARELNTLTGLADRVQILHASTLSLPVPDKSFDHAYSQAALMNIADKRGVFREACRVLRPGGLLSLSLAGAGSAGRARLSVALGYHGRDQASSLLQTKYAAICLQLVLRSCLSEIPAQRLPRLFLQCCRNWKPRDFPHWVSTL
jgi:SAM-dependent methyltransferase